MEKIPDFEKIKTKLKKKLEPFGLWDERKFGLYTFLLVS
jgi:hypothetical protein